MVFAAGLGTRLRPLTERLPKPVVPLMNRPLAAYSLARLAACGVERVAVNTHYLAAEVEAALEGHLPEGLEVTFVHEPDLLGTGGGLKNGLQTLLERASDDGPYLVMNGDIFFWPDLEGALALHEELGAVATMVLREDPRAARLGALGVDPTGRVRRLLGKPEEVEGSLRETMFTGVHVLSPQALEGLPDQGCVIRHAYRRWIDEGEVVAGFVDPSPWRDLGTPAEYLRAHLDLLRGDLVWPAGLPASPTEIEVAPDARLEEVVVGEGARIGPAVSLARCVVWPGSTVERSLSDAIIAPHAVVAVDPESR